MATLRSETLVHGENAWGAKYLVRGFTRSPETDLLYALGFPHLRRLVVDHPDNALTGEALREKILSPYGSDIPAAFAARRVRTQAIFIANADGSWRKDALEAFEDDSPFTKTSAVEFIDALLPRREFGSGQSDVAFTLEALLGADVVAQAATDVFEGLSPEELGRHHNPGWGAYLGIILLRTSKAVGDALVPRLEKTIERGFSAPEVNGRSVAVKLDQLLHGHRRSEVGRGSTLFFSELPWWSDAPHDVLAEALRTCDINKWDFAVEPRLAMLCPDPVIDVYRKRWSVLKDAEAQRNLVEWFGEIVHPGIAPLIADMAEKSKAKKAARAWLDAQSGGAPAAAPAKGTKKAAKKMAAESTPAPAKLAVPKLDPDAILAKLDAGVKGNDWPDFFELNPEDVLHGMRIVALRAGSDWGIALERLQGDDPETLIARTWLFGSTDTEKNGYSDQPVSFSVEEGEATGPRGSMDLTKVKGKKPKFEAIARAYHAHFDGGLWPSAATTAALFQFAETPEIVVVSDAFAHVALASGKKKQALPSESKTYVSLAKAVATGDGSLFTPGKSNV